MEELEKRVKLEPLRRRYKKSGRKEKATILRTVEELFGVGRRQARRLLSAGEPGRPKTPRKRGRRSLYSDAAFQRALRELWREMRRMGSKQFCEARKEWLPALERKRGRFEDGVRNRLLQVSPATVDRILRAYKALKGKSSTVRGGFRDEIPIQKSVWNQTIPGYLECDTVAHCGGSLLGEYIYTLTMVDIATLWNECRPSFGTPLVSLTFQ